MTELLADLWALLLGLRTAAGFTLLLLSPWVCWMLLVHANRCWTGPRPQAPTGVIEALEDLWRQPVLRLVPRGLRGPTEVPAGWRVDPGRTAAGLFQNPGRRS